MVVYFFLKIHSNKTMNNNQPDEFMQAAIAEAKQGLNEGGIPIGSVIVRDGKIVGRGHNRRVQHNDPMAHAEIDCLQNAGRIGNYGRVDERNAVQSQRHRIRHEAAGAVACRRLTDRGRIRANQFLEAITRHRIRDVVRDIV